MSLLVIIVVTAASISLGILKYRSIGNDNSTYTVPHTLDVTAELTNATLVKKRTGSVGNSKLSNFIEADIVIYNNSSKSIGLDPNYCDYEIYVNGQKLQYPKACTQRGGVLPVKKGKKNEHRISSYAPDAKDDDSVYIEYGYIILSDNQGTGASYRYDDSYYVKSSSTIIKTD